MNNAEAKLLEAFSCALHDEHVQWAEPIQNDDWLRLLRLASENRLLPMIAQATYLSPVVTSSARRAEYLTRKAKSETLAQAKQTAEFTLFYRYLAGKGLLPIVTKGIMCRELYPHPDQRISVDEDLLVDPDDFMRYHQALEDYGFELYDPDSRLDIDHEVAYKHPDNHMYIEVHKCFFPPDSEAYGDCNAALEHAAERSVEVNVRGVKMRTLAPTDHLLYLILHAYKHFLHSGVGIRQIADINMFAKHYSAEIDWERIGTECKKLRIDRMTAAMFGIGREYLGFEERPSCFADNGIDVEPLLEDIITGGLYGTNDINRLHSSNMTLDAVAAQKNGRKARSTLKSLFPSAAALESRYAYLRRKPWLLPAAWVQRAWRYIIKRENGPVSPAESLKIGKNRIALLQQYGIIDS